ncbi:PREDICTED: transcription factor PIF3-like [Nicotiana attenuata]|uniref:Transcription factor pif1 n=1 Tax=Nicotiana attenuata TaxID=49451 RepID=A0A1J6KFN9_NICAT|nr:PREDICTED: transcription factor PIF3-like [Nicotiana attenuata]OIT27508.1 transcription factor pif1 [Nicotiana attenuata]
MEFNKENDVEKQQDLSQDEGEDEINLATENGNYTDEMLNYYHSLHNVRESNSRNTTRWRRERVDKRIKALRELIPGCDKVDQASILDDAIKYIQALQQLHQITSMRMGLMPQEAYMSQAGMMQMPRMEPTNGIMANQTVIPPFALPTSNSSLQMVPQFQAPVCPQFLQSTACTMPLSPSFFTTPSRTMTQGCTASNPRGELLREYEEAIDYNNSGQGVQGESSNSAFDSTTEKS